MSNQNVLQSPLVQIDFAEFELTKQSQNKNTLWYHERPFHSHINLRGSIDDAVLISAAQQVLGGSLPVLANTAVTNGDSTVFWLGPDEWLILTPSSSANKLVDTLRTALQNTFCSVIDISGGNTIIEIGGPAAEELMCKGSTLDFHPDVFSLGDCAQTLFAKTNVLIYPAQSMQTNGKKVYRMIVRRSFADYFARWLIDAAAEFVFDQSKID